MKIKSLFGILLAGLLLAGCAAPAAAPLATETPTPAPQPANTPAPTKVPMTPTPEAPEFKVIAYVTDWDPAPEEAALDRLTHINYAFVLPKTDGTLSTLANGWKLEALVKQGHARGVKVLISVGGWGLDQQFEVMAAGEGTRARFVKEMVAFVDQYQLDGVDIDWEYPRPGASSKHFVALMTELRAALRPDLLLTAAVAAVGPSGDGIDPAVFELVDFINLMVYDGGSPNHASMDYAAQSLDYWSKRGLSAEKTVLGVPFYSRPGEVPYKKLVGADPAAAQVDEFVYQGIKEGYNGLVTMRQKVLLARERASGVMIWALVYDTTDDLSLLKAIDETAHSSLP
ncbi:MAG TPA: glycoside hydrolase family 18 protein [Anaerolineaceae bacterium]|nr:glycoside hydrolase family 18 protein [Anaerolineaceae bacterium]HPN51241.1 glycoside hydrolase family 18 protein [Anaerolineaceae bacterium]